MVIDVCRQLAGCRQILGVAKSILHKKKSNSLIVWTRRIAQKHDWSLATAQKLGGILDAFFVYISSSARHNRLRAAPRSISSK